MTNHTSHLMHITVKKTTETLMKTYQKVDVSCLGTKTKGKKERNKMMT